MFIGHIPAGYLTAKALQRKARERGISSTHFIFAGVAGAIAPDIDLLYFYLLDGRAHHHHTYATHFPVVWASAFLACAMWWLTGKARQWALLAGIFALGGFGHMLLDSVVGDIAWGAPWDMRFFSLFEVRAAYRPWWLNFILNWSFALEIVLTAAAVIVWRRRPHRLSPRAWHKPVRWSARIPDNSWRSQ